MDKFDAEVALVCSTIVISLFAHTMAWLLFFGLSSILHRVDNCNSNLQSATAFLEFSEIANQVLELSADKLQFDPDLHQFEKDVAIRGLKDPELLYTNEVMSRPNKPPPRCSKEVSVIKSNKSKIDKSDKKKKKEGGSEKKNKSSKSKKSNKSNKSNKSKKDKSRKSSKSKKSKKSKKEKKEKTKEEQAKDVFEKPQNSAEKVASKDPNYQTLVACSNDVFGENKKKEKFKAPEKVEKADAKDPQYETLNGIGNELFNEEQKKENEKKELEKKKEFKEPEKVKKADAKDPQYETLADVKDDIFKGT